MNRKLLILLIGLMLPLSVMGQHYQSDFPPAEFEARWAKLFDAIGDKAVAVVQGAPKVRGFTFPRQNNSFYYLSGIETPHSYILLDGRTREVTLYLPEQNAALERSEGKILSAATVDLVQELTGAHHVKSTEDFKEIDCRIIYVPFSPGENVAESRHEIKLADEGIANDRWDGRLSRDAQFQQLIRTRHRNADVRNLSPILDEMRLVKSKREIALLRMSGKLTALGIIEAMKSTKPGVWEYQLDAVARYVFQANDARLEGYRSITASGVANINNAHYYRNSSQAKSGSLILMDFSPDYHYYTSDIGRMWPVNGKYTSTQRELLEIILVYHEMAISLIRPGVTRDQIFAELTAKMEPIMKKAKFSKEIYRKAAEKMVRTGGGVYSHNVGMAVHDVGDYRKAPLVPGIVFCIDPQIRVPEENLYLRYEDTGVVTETGYENFTKAAPTKLDDIEKLMKKEGMLQAYPALKRK